MYQNILIAVDSSNEACAILAKASKLAQLHQANVQILHVAEYPLAGGIEVGYLPQLNEKEIKKELENTLLEWVEKAGLASANVVIKFGRAADYIVEYAKTNNVDLILLGSHGRHGLQLLLGSTANAVLHHAPCDVLAVRIKEE